MSKAIQVTTHWPGFSGIKHVVIFGDSYSAVGYSCHEDHPTPKNPLGVVFPGETFNEPGKPNWVGHMLTKYSPGRKYTPSTSELDGELSSIVVYDYAVGGDTVHGVSWQVEGHFLPDVGKRPNWAPWNAEDTLFVSWIGINDCAAMSDPTGRIEYLMKIQRKLYDCGARNFLFIDVPPIHKSPAGLRFNHQSCYTGWNEQLRESANNFAALNADCTILIFSSYATFNRILIDPVSNGFESDDSWRPFGGIWVDNLHPSSKVHDILARDISAFLSSVEPSSSGDSEQILH